MIHSLQLPTWYGMTLYSTKRMKRREREKKAIVSQEKWIVTEANKIKWEKRVTFLHWKIYNNQCSVLWVRFCVFFSLDFMVNTLKICDWIGWIYLRTMVSVEEIYSFNLKCYVALHVIKRGCALAVLSHTKSTTQKTDRQTFHLLVLEIKGIMWRCPT